MVTTETGVHTIRIYKLVELLQVFLGCGTASGSGFFFRGWPMGLDPMLSQHSNYLPKRVKRQHNTSLSTSKHRALSRLCWTEDDSPRCPILILGVCAIVKSTYLHMAVYIYIICNVRLHLWIEETYSRTVQRWFFESFRFSESIWVARGWVCKHYPIC